MKYRRIKLLGVGGYGEVHLIEDIKTLNKYALKKIKLDAKTYNSCLNEIKILTSINSNYIIQIYNYFIKKNYLYIIMEYAPYGDLFYYIQNKKKNNKRISENYIKYIICSISKGIRDLHRNNIIHRDLKPSNILICKNGKIKIADFGISRIVDSNHHYIITKVGTPYYMSPEIIDGNRYSYSVDHWSLGCIFYELVTFKRPFQSSNILSLCNKIHKGVFNKNIVPEKYLNIIMGLLNKSSYFRFNEREVLTFFNDDSSYNIKIGYNVYSRTELRLPKININDSLKKKRIKKKINKKLVLPKIY